MIGRAIMFLSALLLAACAEDPLARGSFPCAGDGTCPGSLVCTAGTGSDPAEAMCMEDCAASTDCEEGSRCAAVGEAAACLPECTPFGTDCEGATTCRVQPLAAGEGFFATCVTASRGHELYSTCESALDCPPQAACFRASDAAPFTCQPQCDAEHPCRRNTTCQPLLPSGAGVCI